MSGRIGKSIQALPRLIADAIWPRTCIVCDRDDNLTPEGICHECYGRLIPAEPVTPPKKLHRLDVLFAYDETLRKIVHRFKFEDARNLAGPLAELMRERLEQIRFRLGASIIVPIPDHPTRHRQRGYNPAELLAVELGRRLDRPVHTGLLHRVQYGEHQSVLSDKERVKMPESAFSATAPERGMDTAPILLIDDVVHTGTTVSRAALALKRVGWRRIDALCLCR